MSKKKTTIIEGIPLLNALEYSILKPLDNRYGYIGRDTFYLDYRRETVLVVFTEKVTRTDIKKSWIDGKAFGTWKDLSSSFSNLFKFIKCKDTELYSIHELLETYEKNKERTNEK